MKIRIILRQKKPKTHDIDMQKWNLAFICSARFWRAYNTQFSRAYDKKFVGVHMIRSFRVHMGSRFKVLVYLSHTQSYRV